MMTYDRGDAYRCSIEYARQIVAENDAMAAEARRQLVMGFAMLGAALVGAFLAMLALEVFGLW